MCLEGTLVFLVVIVDQHVTLELVFPVECRLTLVTFKWFLVAVNHLVHSQVVLSGETLLTDLALVFPWKTDTPEH